MVCVPIGDKMALTRAFQGLEHHGIANKGKLLCVHVGTYGPEPYNSTESSYSIRGTTWGGASSRVMDNEEATADSSARWLANDIQEESAGKCQDTHWGGEGVVTSLLKKFL
jgi:hypothetical protein